MKISRTELSQLLTHLNLSSVPLAISKLQGVVHTSIKKNTLAFQEQLDLKLMQQPAYINQAFFHIFLETAVLQQVRKHLPHLLLPTDFKLNFEESFKLLSSLQLLNSDIKRKRKLVFAKDLFKQKLKGDPVILYASSHEEVTQAALTKLRHDLTATAVFTLEFAYNELGCYVYHEAASKQFSMVTVVLKTLKKLNLPHQVFTNPKELYAAYAQKPARLVVITHSSESHKSKWLYMMLKQYDVIAKILELDEPTWETLSSFPRALINLYRANYLNSNRPSLIPPYQKPQLPQTELDYFKDELLKLIVKYDPVKHVKIGYALQKKGEQYNLKKTHFFLSKLPPHQ